MSKKLWFAILFFVLICICVFTFAYYYTHKGHAPSPVVSVYPALTQILPGFPTGLPVPASARVVGYQSSTVGNTSLASFQYVSTSTVTQIMQTYSDYFKNSAWTTSTLPSPAGSQALSAQTAGQTLLVTAIPYPATKQTVISLSETTMSVNPFPADFPTEQNASTTNSIATSTKSIITYDRTYTSKLTLAANVQTFSTYLTKNGFHVGTGPINAATNKSIIATKTNEEYEIVLAEDPQTSIVYVDIRLTFYK